MYQPLAKSPQALLLQSANETCAVGLLFALLGILPMVLAVSNSSAWQTQVLAAVNSLVLVGPGVWYFLAGRWLRRSQLWVLPITLKIGIGQIALVILLIPVACASSPFRGLGTFL